MKLKGYLGLGLLVFLFLAYFIPLTVDSGENYIVNDRLLGVLIFHNIFVLGIYILIGLVLIFLDMKKVKFV